MSQKRRFRAVIEDAGDGGAFVTVPFDEEAKRAETRQARIERAITMLEQGKRTR